MGATRQCGAQDAQRLQPRLELRVAALGRPATFHARPPPERAGRGGHHDQPATATARLCDSSAASLTLTASVNRSNGSRTRSRVTGITPSPSEFGDLNSDIWRLCRLPFALVSPMHW